MAFCNENKEHELEIVRGTTNTFEILVRDEDTGNPYILKSDQALVFGLKRNELDEERPLVKKFILPKNTPTNFEQIIGQTAVVCEEINNTEATGAIKINGLEWSARSDDGNIIPCGDKVTVVKIEGVKAIVSQTQQ
mgnify:CR=1 FL=1